MGLGKVVLIFQAIITLILGIAFFVSVFNFQPAEITDAGKIAEFGQNFKTASYILIILASIEIMIISRFV